MTDPGPDPGYDAAALSTAAGRLGLRLVVRFGSRAAGAVPPPRDESDVDVAVLADPARRVTLPELAHALAPAFPGLDLDVAILNDADPVFLDEVFRRCDLLWGDPLLFAEREAHAYRAFMETADLRALERAVWRRLLDTLLDAPA